MSHHLPNCDGDFPDLREIAERDIMQALGMLSAGIAHEMKTPLGAIGCAHGTQRTARDKIIARLEELAPQVMQDADIQRALRALTEGDKIVDTGLERVIGLVTQLRRFLQQDLAEPGPVDVVALIDGALLLSAHLLRSNITTRREYAGAPPATGYPGQTGQILLNLIINAAQALGADGGSLTISTATAGDQLQVIVADDGPGVASDDTSRIFEFGYTTRAEQGGTGFGLALSRHMARKQGGDLTLAATPGGGATFTLSLPLASATGDPASDS